MPTIVHPDLGESTCSESAVRLYERNGWKRKPAAKKSGASAPASEKASTAVAETTPNTKES